jgi:hypothetical protein
VLAAAERDASVIDQDVGMVVPVLDLVSDPPDGGLHGRAVPGKAERRVAMLIESGHTTITKVEMMDETSCVSHYGGRYLVPAATPARCAGGIRCPDTASEERAG